MNDSNLSFTAVFYDGTMKEYKSGEDIRSYYSRDEVYRVYVNYNGQKTVIVPDLIFDLPANREHLVNGGIR